MCYSGTLAVAVQLLLLLEFYMVTI